MENKKNIVTVHAKPLDMLPSIVGVKPNRQDVIAKKSLWKKQDVTVELNLLDALKKEIPVRAHKLLLLALAEFTKQNQFDKKKQSHVNTHVRFQLKEVVEILGYDVSNRTQRDNAYKGIKSDLRVLQALTITWQSKKDKKDYRSISVIDLQGIVGGVVEIEFTLRMAEYLLKQPRTTLPLELFVRHNG